MPPPETCDCPAEAGAATCETGPKSRSTTCPGCDSEGKAVALLTVKATVVCPLTELRSSGYRFCRTSTCPVVYYSLDGHQRLAETDLREPVHQKNPRVADVPVCYCFRHSPGSIAAEIG